jgi:hypothetical protein
MSHPNTIKVKPWSADQGDHVLINESDFDSKVHEKFDESDDSATGGAMKVSELKEALTAKGITFSATAKKAELQALLDAAPAA